MTVGAGTNVLRGFFITFEGGEGAGKSTQIRSLDRALRGRGYDTLLTREPGGSSGAEAARHVLLSSAAKKFGVEMEAILFAAARNDHVCQLIRPAIRDGKIVLCDRFLDSSRVYQGVSGNLDPTFMHNLEKVAIEDTVPNLTFILDLDPVEGLRRVALRGEAADRFESDVMEMHERRRKAFLEIAEREPQRCVVIDASKSEAEIAADILANVSLKLEKRPS